MIRLPYILLLILLVSNCYAAEAVSTPDSSATRDESISNVTDAISNPALSDRNNYASASEPFRALERKKLSDNLYRASQITFIGSIVADLSTTWALPQGMSEGDPLLGKSKTQQVAVSGALTLFALWEAHVLHSKGKTRAAKFLLWTGTIGHAFTGYYNMHQR